VSPAGGWLLGGALLGGALLGGVLLGGAELGGGVVPPVHAWPLTVQLAGAPLPVAMNPNEVAARGARVPFQATLVNV
jgi:hypothetical protein